MSERVKELAQDFRENERVKLENARKRIPEEYHDFLVELDNNGVLFNYEIDEKSIPEEEKGKIFPYKGKTFIRLKKPYVAVDGRIAMFSADHKKEGAKFFVTSNIEQICSILENKQVLPHTAYPLIVRVESELYGSLEGVSRIFWDGEGANQTNPLETAYTSAVGRALAQAGYGLVGTGIASAEEASNAMSAAGKNKKEYDQSALQEQPPKKEKANKTTNENRKKDNENYKTINAVVVTLPEKMDNSERTMWGLHIKARDNQGNEIDGQAMISNEIVSEDFINSLNQGDQLQISGPTGASKNKDSFQFVVIVKEVQIIEKTA